MPHQPRLERGKGEIVDPAVHLILMPLRGGGRSAILQTPGASGKQLETSWRWADSADNTTLQRAGGARLTTPIHRRS